MIENNQINILEKSLQNGAELKTYSLINLVMEETVLHAAARMNRVACLKILLDYYPARKNLENIAIYYESNTPQFLTPLQVAIRKNNSACEILLK